MKEQMTAKFLVKKLNNYIQVNSVNRILITDKSFYWIWLEIWAVKAATRGAFNNYVDRILPFIDPPSCVDSFCILSADKNKHFVYIVIEWPTTRTVHNMKIDKIFDENQ